jgi:Spy/CpxP family protein refolding chaperone
MRRIEMKKKLAVTAAASVFLFFVLMPLVSGAQPARNPRAMLMKDILDLTPDQEAKLKEHREARMKDEKAFREQLKKLNGQLRETMKDPKADPKKVDALIDEVSKLKADRMKSGLRHRKELETIFTPEQLAKIKDYKEAFGDRTPLMGRGGLGRRGAQGFRLPPFRGGARGQGIMRRPFRRFPL